MQAGQRVCTACPRGYSGSGETGCAPLEVHAGDLFGAYVAGYGDTLVIGAPHEAISGNDGRVSNAGAVYVFVHERSGWRQQVRLTSENVATDDLFGASVSVCAKLETRPPSVLTRPRPRQSVAAR